MSNKVKILYVDDEYLNVQVFKITFSKNYHVVTASGGPEGLDLLHDNPDIQFIISDMKMPVMDGLEFIKKVKKINSSLPCMILSGYEQSQETLDAQNNEIIVDYMMKPFNKTKIEELINKYIS